MDVRQTARYSRLQFSEERRGKPQGNGNQTSSGQAQPDKDLTAKVRQRELMIG